MLPFCLRQVAVDLTFEVSITSLRGRANLIAQAERLNAIARRTQASLVIDKTTLEFLARLPNGLGSKVPVVIFVQDKLGEDLAAVLLNEYTVVGCRTGLYTPFDLDGEYTVIARASEAADVVRVTSEHLLTRCGARLLLFSRRGDQTALLTEEHAAYLSSIYTCGSQTRTLRRTFRLASTYHDTLACLGAHTRRNFRRYRRKLEECYSAEFLSTVDLGGEEFLRFSNTCSHPIAEEVSRWRNSQYGKAPGTFMVGLRAKNGSWLSLLGGRRHGTLTRVDWQMNLVELKGHSVVNAMRSWLIEHEIALGMHSLGFERGTMHSSSNVFTSELVSDVVVSRSIFSPHFIERWLLRLLPKTGTLPLILDLDILHWY